MEITGGFVVLELLVELTDGQVGFKRFFRVTLAPVLFTINQTAAESG
jgi:hypothetical protein